MSERRSIDELLGILEELRKEVQQSGGRLPNPRDNPQFYARLTAFLDILKEEGVKMTLSEIAERLGVGYAILRRRLSEYRKLERDELEEEAETPEPQITPPSTGPAREPVEVEVPKPREEPEKPVVEESPVTTRTAMRIMEAIKRHFGRKAEQLAKEEVDKIIAIGKKVYEDYEKTCYAYGYDDIMKCIEDAFHSLFEVMPEHLDLKSKYDALKSMVKFLMRITDPYIRAILIIEEASKNLSPEEQLELLEELEESVVGQP